MGMQDRDYYWEWRAKKDGHFERLRRRMGLGKPSHRRTVRKRSFLRSSQWHPVLTFLVTVLICLLVWGALRFVVSLR